MIFVFAALFFVGVCARSVLRIRWLYGWWARPEANASAGLGTGGGLKPARYAIQFCFGKVSERLLVKSEFIQFFHKQRTSSRYETV